VNRPLDDAPAQETTQACVSAIVVTWNSAGVIERCLSSLREYCDPWLKEVVVVDAGSSDDSLAQIAAADPAATVIALGVNVGFSPAVNIGLRSTSGELVLILNPDTVMAHDAIGPLVAALASYPTAAMAAPVIRTETGSEDLFAARQLPSLLDTAFRMSGLRQLLGNRISAIGRETLDRSTFTAITEVPFLTGAALLVRREVLASRGGLDETVPMYFEDVELSGRCEQLGRARLRVAAAEVVHFGGHAAAQSTRRPLLVRLEFAHSKWLYFDRFRGRNAAHAFTLLTAVGSAVQIAGLTAISVLPKARTGTLAAQVQTRRHRAFQLLGWSLKDKESFSQTARENFEPVPDWALATPPHGAERAGHG
jgi:N-acetylglucosaminyl-diphospho-decaprenol L-rhamnosyltransferase